MILANLNQEEVHLRATWGTGEGAAKVDLVACTAQVYLLPDIELLAPVAMVQATDPECWLHTWEPGSLGFGNYMVKYRGTDIEGAQGVMTEDLFVTHISEIFEIEIGNWKLDPVTKTMTFYREDGSILRTFNMFNEFGQLNVKAIFERRKQ